RPIFGRWKPLPRCSFQCRVTSAAPRRQCLAPTNAQEKARVAPSHAQESGRVVHANAQGRWAPRAWPCVIVAARRTSCSACLARLIVR
ncbi:hypothetical protein HAX54_048740, partial [Datura stramonium]|nr:hypothetical protein [Datura stramonium]